MAKAVASSTWENGFRQPTNGSPWRWDDGDDADGYVTAPSTELATSTVHNDLGISVIRTWPTMYNGTNNPHGIPSWWTPSEKVDVLICGAGPSGLAVAASLARQGVSFRILDKAEGPLIAGRADGVQPRFLETIAMWGLATEIHEEGPLIERTAIYKDGKKLLFNRSHQSDSRYRGLHIITQGQVERIYVRDLLRHRALVERSSSLKEYSIDSETHEANSYPVHATILNERTGAESVVQAKYLVGCDGAASKVRKSIGIPFDGVSTDIYWGIMDCVYESDYPHAWVFGSVISSEHGGCVIIPREDGYIRLYTQLNVSHTGPLGASRCARDPSFAESGGNVDVHSITPEEVLEQANRIFAPYKLNFAAPLSWFAIWKISERVARNFSSPDMRVHLVGDAAHVHSVMGAFGLNASVLDAANLSWKLGLAAKGFAKHDVLLPTYNSERRKHAVRIIEVSGTYLRFISGSKLRVPNLSNVEQLDKTKANGEIVYEQSQTESNSDGHETLEDANGTVNGSKSKQQTDDTAGETANGHEKEGRTREKVNGNHNAKDLGFLAAFFKSHGSFLLGVDCPYDISVVSPTRPDSFGPPPLNVKNGVRAPNPRVAFATQETGYLYDKLAGPARFHIVAFASSFRGAEVLRQLSTFAEALRSPDGFYNQFGGASLFNVVLIVKMLPFEFEALPASYAPLLETLRQAKTTVVFDDRAPDEDAHTTWGANHTTGGVAVIRPDLWVGATMFPEETGSIEEYLGQFLHRS